MFTASETVGLPLAHSAMAPGERVGRSLTGSKPGILPLDDPGMVLALGIKPKLYVYQTYVQNHYTMRAWYR